MKSDLHALSHLNDMCKYADDTTLLVPEHTYITIDMEFSHVKAWALTNHLTLNLDKTKEIVFKRPRAHCFHLPPAIDNTEQLDCNKLLGVFFSLILKWTHTSPVHSTNVPNKAAKTSGGCLNSSCQSSRTPLLSHTFCMLSQPGEAL